MNAPAIGVTALFALAAMLGLLGPGSALAQSRNKDLTSATQAAPSGGEAGG